MELVSLAKALAVVVAAGALCLGAGGPRPAGAAERTIAVEAGDHARIHAPVSVELPAGTDKARLTDGGKDVPCQIAGGKLWWIVDNLPAGATRSYTVQLGEAGPAAAAAVEMKKGEAAVDITIDGQPFTTYHFVPGEPAGQRILRPYFFPVFGPGQTTMTRPYPLTKDIPAGVPKDHPHHTSIWVAYGEVNGVDNWSAGAKAGWQIHKSFEALAGGAVFGEFTEVLDWTDVARKPILAERRTVRVWRTPADSRMLDIEVTFRAAYGPVHFGDTKEGGICSTRMRPEFHADKLGKEGRLVNSEGLSGGPTWGKPAKWVDCSGLVDGKRLGFAIFDAPANLRHPTPWHSRTYGLLTANPFGRKCFDKAAEKSDYMLEANKELTLSYRIYFHTGEEKSAAVADRWADFAQPPKATLK